MTRLNKNKIYILLLLLTTAVISVTITVVLVLRNRAAEVGAPSKISSIIVNAVVAEPTKDGDYEVYIPQCEKVSLQYKCNADIECKWYDAHDREIESVDDIFIGGKDIVIKYVLRKNKSESTSGQLSVINVLPKDAGLKFMINNVNCRLKDNELILELPPKTDRIDSAVIAVSDFFGYKLYSDRDRKHEITDLNKLQIQSTYYLDIRNVNKIETIESYTVKIVVRSSSNTEIDGISVNGIDAVFKQGCFSVSIDKTSYLNIDVVAKDERAQTVLLCDDKIIEDATRIFINDGVGEYTFIARVVAENGDIKEYTLNVALIYDTINTINRVLVNGVACFNDNDGFSVLLKRADSLSIDIQLDSILSSATLYYDYDKQHRVENLTDIDTSICESELQYYIFVEAENGDIKSYLLNVHFIPSGICLLNNISINGRPAAFSDNTTVIDIIGGDDQAVSLSDIVVSKYAEYAVYSDEALTVEITHLNEVKISPENKFLYVKVTAEDGENFCVYKIEFNIISNDNSLRGLTINNVKYPVSGESAIIDIESCDKIDISEIHHEDRSSVSVFYDPMQTDQALDLTNIRYQDKKAEIYIRVIAESAEIGVYHITLIIKDAPEIIFTTNTVILSDWQESIDLYGLFEIKNNSYTEDRYSTTVFWNGVRRSARYVAVENERKIHSLDIRIESPYFKTVEFSKQIEIYPYALTPINIEILRDEIETTEQTQQVNISELIDIDGGSYILGKHYYIAVYQNSGTAMITNNEQAIVISPGILSIGVNPIADLFEPFSVGSISVIRKELSPPIIVANEYYEFIPDPNVELRLSELFTINDRGNVILHTAVYIDGIERDSLVLNEGRYEIEIVVLYDKGTVETSFAVFVGELSDNTNGQIRINGETVEFADNRYSVELAYNANFVLTIALESSKAHADLIVNGAASEFGDIRLAIGGSILIIKITAENGDTAEYTIVVNKHDRVLPTINTFDKTIRLAENQTYVRLADCYSIEENEYTVDSVMLYYNDAAINGDILSVTNENKNYDVVVRISGDFGAIEKKFTVGIIRYSAVKINLKPRNIKNRDGYVFTANDFVESIEFIGYNEPYRYEVYLDNAVFIPRPLDDGVYIITVKAWQNDILLREESAVYTIDRHGAEQTIDVRQIKKQIGIDEESAICEFDDLFKIECGEYARDELDVYYIINRSRSYILNLNVGQNTFDVVIVEISSQIELFAKTFTVDCDYRPTAEKIFDTLSINGDKMQVNGNVVAIVSSNELDSIELAYTLRSGFTEAKLERQYNIHKGINYIGFTVIKNGYTASCVLELYSLNSLDDYINTVRYANYISENNMINVSSETEFDVSLFSVDLSDNHIGIEIMYKQIEPNVYDVTVCGKYNDIDIGRIIIRIFIGKEKPILRDILLSVLDESIASYSINEFSVDMICVSDKTSIAPVFKTINDEYIVDCNIADLKIGLNKIAFYVIDSSASERFMYSLNISLFPQKVVSRVEYSGTPLPCKNNVFIAEVDVLSSDDIGYSIDERIDLQTTYKIQQTLYNGIVVGYDYTVIYDHTEIYRFSVALLNDNSAVKVICDKVELVQYGNDKFTMNLNIDKASQEGKLIKRFSIQSLYPYTKIIGKDVKPEQDGYSIVVDFGDIGEMEQGTINKTVSFSAESLKSIFDYTIVIDLTVSETDEATAPLVITVNNKDKLYFTDADLEKEFIMFGRTLNANIFDRDMILTIGGTAAYNFYEDNIVKNSIKLTAVYDGYLNFYIIKDHRPKRVTIPCEYMDDNGNAIDTGIRINGVDLLITENASAVEIVYGGVIYQDVLLADKTLSLPVGTTEAEAEFFGFLAEEDSFVFADGSVGKSGTLSIQGNRLIIFIDNYGTKVPYAVIEIEFSEERK